MPAVAAAKAEQAAEYAEVTEYLRSRRVEMSESKIQMACFFAALSDSERLRWVHLIEMQAACKVR